MCLRSPGEEIYSSSFQSLKIVWSLVFSVSLLQTQGGRFENLLWNCNIENYGKAIEGINKINTPCDFLLAKH